MPSISENNSNFDSKRRIRIFKIIVILLTIVFIGRLAFLQIIRGNIYRAESETQAIKQVIVEPFRGDMFDRDGKLLVHNEPSFAITITKNDFIWESLPLLSSLLDVDSTEIIQIIKGYKGVSKFTPLKIYKDVAFDKVALIEEYNDILPGVDIVVESKRLYDFNGHMAHVLGYNKEISSYQLKRKSFYRPGDVVGQTGLENSYEEQLRGSKGVKFVAVNKFGVKVASFDDGRSDIPASNGFDLYLTIDSDLQKTAETLLKNWRGAIVAIDPNNGEILAMASSPDYDLRDFSGKIPGELYTKLITNPDAPMYHRAIMSKYAPGSTWKMLMAIAGLNEGIIDKNTSLHCGGQIKLGVRTFKCHGAHGNINVTSAIRASCNVFFYELAMKLGLKNIEKYGHMFGFGNKSFVDLPNEKTGILPTLEWAEKKFGTTDIPSGYLVNFGIGQGEIAATPLQMANYTAAIANKGTLYQPHIVKSVHNNFTNKIEPLAYDSKSIPVKKEVFDIIQQGMYEVIHKPGGTARNAGLPGIKVCGKTGTAQNVGKDHSWFVCFAPEEKPEIALCVMIENGGFGNEVAAPISRKMLWNFFKLDTLYKSENLSTSDSLSHESSTFLRQ